jgi:uncharacterized protein YbjT (DUF2867 family)
MIAVMGATGHTGRGIAEQLLLKGEKVRALGRSDAKLASLAASGAEIASGDVADADFLTKAFRGANAVYTLLPTDRRSIDYSGRQDDERRAIATAIRESGVRFVVALSSVGAELPAGTGIITGHYRLEERLRAIDGINVCLLRPVSLFENILEQLPVIEQLGVFADTVAPDLQFPMVATRDIAAVAADALVARNWSGVIVRELLGPRDLTHREIATRVGERLGRPGLQYVQLSYAEMAGALEQAGLSPGFARLYCEMTQAFNEGRVQPRTGRTRENSTATTFEQFLDEAFGAPVAPGTAQTIAR